MVNSQMKRDKKWLQVYIIKILTCNIEIFFVTNTTSNVNYLHNLIFIFSI